MTAEEQKNLQAVEAENVKLREENSELQARLLRAQQTLAKYAQMLFGQKTDRARLPEKPEELTGNLFEQEMDPGEQDRLDKEAAKAVAEQDKLVHVEAHDRKVRKPIDTSRLEVKEEHLYPDLDNAEDYTEMSPEVTDSLVLVPRQMYIRRIIRHKYVLKSRLQVENPDRKAFEIATLPPAPLHKCMADATLLADIIINKYRYHLPFYRVIQSYKELGVSISPSTINDWFKAVVGKLKPIYDLLRAHVLACDYVQVDESTLPVIDNEKHRAVKGYMWCVRAVIEQMVVFYYDMGSRSHDTARKMLRGYRGTIQTDGYGAYDQFENDPHIQVIGCWAHARRKWSDALDEDRRTASEALVYINKLYHIESAAKEAGIIGDALKTKRQEEAYPIILQFEKWMYGTAGKVSQNSRVGKAISYTLPLLPRLSRYVNDGRFCIDNNLVENAIRPLALGRKNYLFCGNHDAAIRAAIVYSLIDSCKALGVDPRVWMEDVLLRIPGNENNRTALRELLPDKWAKKSN